LRGCGTSQPDETTPQYCGVRQVANRWACRMWENVKTGDSITVESDNAAACKLVFNSNVVAPRQWREKK